MNYKKTSGAGMAKIPKLQLGDFAFPAVFQLAGAFKMQITLKIGKLLLSVKIDVGIILALIAMFGQ